MPVQHRHTSSQLLLWIHGSFNYTVHTDRDRSRGRQTVTSVDDLVVERRQRLGRLLEQRPVVSVELYAGQAADEAGARPDVAAEVRRTSARRQTTHEQLVAHVEVHRVTPPVAALTPRDVISRIIIVVIVINDVRRLGVVDA